MRNEQDKAQPIACVEDAAFYNKVYFLTLLAHRKDTAFDNPFHKYEYARMVQAIEAVKELMPPEYFAEHHPATDWDALEQKFYDWWKFDEGDAILNFFKNELTK